MRESAPVLLVTLLLLVPLAVGALARMRELPSPEAPHHRVFRDLERGPERFDAVVFGSSRGLFGVNPTSFGRGPSYNLALAGGSGRITQLMVERFRASGSTARLALIEVNPNMFDPVHMWQRPVHLVDAIGLEAAADSQLRQYTDEWLGSFWFFYESLPLLGRGATPEQFLFGIAEPVEAEPLYRPEHYERGHFPLPDYDGERDGCPAETIRQGELAARGPLFEEAEVRGLELAIAELQAAGARVVLFATPLCDVHRTGPAYERYDAEIVRIAADHGVRYFDYRHGELTSSTSDRENYFWDRTHLSQSGARVFSRELWAEVEGDAR